MAGISWNKFIGSFAIFQLLLVGVLSEDLIIRSNAQPNFNGKKDLENYIEQNDRQFLAQIDGYEVELNNFRSTYSKQVNAVAYQEDYVLTEINKVDQQLYPLELLNELNKYCVQEYRSILPSISSVRTAYASCISTASNAINSILSSPTSYVQTLKNYYNGVNYKTALADCERKNNDSYANHTLCVTNVISKANAYFISYQVSFKKSMDSAYCTADNRIRDAVECVFKVNNSTISSNGVAVRLIDDCISGIELCERCQDQTNTTTVVPNHDCPNIINMSWKGDIFKNATINNPFYGLSTSVNCIQINLTQPA